MSKTRVHAPSKRSHASAATRRAAASRSWSSRTHGSHETFEPRQTAGLGGQGAHGSFASPAAAWRRDDSPAVDTPSATAFRAAHRFSDVRVVQRTALPPRPVQPAVTPAANVVYRECDYYDQLDQLGESVQLPDIHSFVEAMHQQCLVDLRADLGFGNQPHQAGCPPFSQYSLLERSAIAFELAMLYERLRYRTLPPEDRAGLPVPDQTLERSRGRGSAEQQAANQQARAQGLEAFRQGTLRPTAEEIFQEMLTDAEQRQEVRMGDTHLAAAGDGTDTTALLGKTDLGVGYFAYDETTMAVNDDTRISYDDNIPAGSMLEIRLNAYGFDNGLLNVQISGGPTTIAWNMNENGGAPNLPDCPVNPVAPAGETETPCSPGVDAPPQEGQTEICVQRSGGNAVVLRIPETFRGTTFQVRSASRNGSDEIQLVITTNGLINRRTLRTEDLFDSGSFQADTSNLNEEQARRIDEFAAALGGEELFKTIQQRLQDTEGEVDLSDLASKLGLEGRGVSQEVEMPAGDSCPTSIEDVQDLRKEALIDCFGTFYQERYRSLSATQRAEIDDNLHDALGEEGAREVIEELSQPDASLEAQYALIRAWFEEYRYSEAALVTGGGLRISSTTDPQGVVRNPSAEADSFVEYYGGIGADLKQALEPLVTRDEKGHMGRRNNHILSALRSLSFFELLLGKAGLAPADINRLTVPVTIHGTHADAAGVTIHASLRDVPDPAR